MSVPFLCVAVALTAYYLIAVLVLRRGLRSLPVAGAGRGLTFSVVIAARNEEEMIGECLRRVLSQTIPAHRYEVIVVDDRSTDRTAAVVSAMAGDHPLSLVKISETPAGTAPKKHAVTQGVRAARNEVVVITDADCRVPSTWLETIDRYFTPQTNMVQGMTTYWKEPGMHPLLFGIQALDFLSHGIVAAAAVGAGIPLNSNANNLAFRRSFFLNVDGYGDARSVVSGDDDLLLQRAARMSGSSLRYMTSAEGAVTTRPTPTVRGIIEQRKRWASKTVHYNLGQRLFLGGIFLFYLCIFALAAMGILYPAAAAAAAVMVCGKIAGELLLLVPGARIFGQKRLLRYTVPASIMQLGMVLFAVIAGVFGTFQWKNQRFARRVGT